MRVIVITCQIHANPFITDGIAHFRRYHLLVAKVLHEIVVHLGTHESNGSSRCFKFITHTCSNSVTISEIEDRTHLHTAVQEMSFATLAVAVVLEKAVTHETFTPHTTSTHLC